MIDSGGFDVVGDVVEEEPSSDSHSYTVDRADDAITRLIREVGDGVMFGRGSSDRLSDRMFRFCFNGSSQSNEFSL